MILKSESASPGVLVELIGVRGSGPGVGATGPTGGVSGPAEAGAARRAARRMMRMVICEIPFGGFILNTVESVASPFHGYRAGHWSLTASNVRGGGIH